MTTNYLGNSILGSATIANGQQSSAVIPLQGYTLAGIFIPAAFTGTALTFEAAPAVDGTFVPVNGIDGDPISYTVAPSQYYAIDPKDFQGINFLKIKSGSAEGGARVLPISVKGL